MNTKLPLYRQEKRNTCALACLRMVLAAYGMDVEESTLESQAHMVPDGTEIDELERLRGSSGSSRISGRGPLRKSASSWRKANWPSPTSIGPSMT